MQQSLEIYLYINLPEDWFIIKEGIQERNHYPL